ncbi:hypothetical protein [Domibacillus enclensis]|uniref:Uncharacterized protein n=1 Tax=Domibacillus enclensis TaxID=1017273 RepID=A0A1N7B0D1_9BACI|nr:hypothetical protein [Domibacillus enclensis]SIR44774.1 hypothetical protein SAMN05443094_108101 [Domibacillus enclensis]
MILKNSVAERLDSSFFWKSTHWGSGLPASLSYWANAEPAQKAWLFHPVRSSSGSLRQLPSARCLSNEPRRRKVLEKGLFSVVNE